MRTRFITGKGEGALVLSVSPGMREQVLSRELEWAETRPHPLLAPVSHDTRGRKISAMYYQVTGTHAIADLLEDGVNEQVLGAVLLGAAEVISACVCSGMDAGWLYLDTEWVYVGEDGRPWFIFLPLNRPLARHQKGLPSGHLASFLLQMAEGIPTCRTQRARDMLQRIADYAERPISQITLRTYCSLLEFSLGISLAPTTYRALQLLDQRDPTHAHELHIRPSERSPSGGTWRGVNVNSSFDAFQREGGLATGSSGTTESLGSGIFGTFGTMNTGQTNDMEETPTQVQGEAPSFGGGRFEVQQTMLPAYTLVRQSNGERYPLYEGKPARVGRGASSDARVLGNPKISRNHVTITCSGGQVQIQDSGSVNGTGVDGRRLRSMETVRIAVGQRFTIANEQFVVQRSA